MKRQNYFFILIGILLVGGFAVLTGFLFYNKPVSEVAEGKPLFEVSSQQLYNEFTSDEVTANSKYLGKVITVNGTIQDITTATDKSAVTLMLSAGDEMSGVTCEVDIKNNPDAGKLVSGDQVSVKGICTGMLMDVVLTNCSIQKS